MVMQIKLVVAGTFILLTHSQENDREDCHGIEYVETLRCHRFCLYKSKY